MPTFTLAQHFLAKAHQTTSSAMMKRFFFPMLIAAAAMLVQCAKKNPLDPRLIGIWQGVEWKTPDGQTVASPDQVSFRFDPDGSYSARLGGFEERGSWRVDGSKLYTTAEDKIEKAVKIASIDAASLVFEMNRQGRAETLKLRRAAQ